MVFCLGNERLGQVIINYASATDETIIRRGVDPSLLFKPLLFPIAHRADPVSYSACPKYRMQIKDSGLAINCKQEARQVTIHPPRLAVEPSLRSPSPEGRGGQGVRTTPPSAACPEPREGSHHHPPAAPCASGTAPPRCERWPTRPSARHCCRTDTARRRPTPSLARRPRPSRPADRRSHRHARAGPPASPRASARTPRSPR